ncbi:MAG TPA: hypothetical protein VM939_10790, partial [Gemmatimonadaceae bacterium]|nr:hypothetical protein [Gemmatimonadaceae bacterium]
ATLLAAQWANANGFGDVAPHQEQMGKPPTYPVARSVYKSKGKTVVDLWMIQGLAHAWSGGSKAGTYTDERGPDAGHAIVNFFQEVENNR